MAAQSKHDMRRKVAQQTTQQATPAITLPDPATLRWRYGDAWERYPMRVGERWRVGTGEVMVHNLFHPLPAFMRQADALFIDPPWNLGNINSFYTKAGRTDYLDDYELFARRLFACITEIAPRICYIEMGAQYATQAKIHLRDCGYPCVDAWPVTYYRKHPCWLLKGSHTPHNYAAGRDYTGMDEADAIAALCAEEDYQVIGDMCMGRGLVGYHAWKARRRFVGTELNPRRLACLLDRVAKDGGEVARI